MVLTGVIGCDCAGCWFALSASKGHSLGKNLTSTNATRHIEPMQKSIARLHLSLNSRPRPHGTRARYQAGCRCLACRIEIARLVLASKRRRRNGSFNGLVPIRPAQKHLRKLSRAGVGTRAVSDSTGIHRWKLETIKAGRQKYLRAEHERKILSVTKDLLADGAQISANETWMLVDRLMRYEGFRQTDLASEIPINKSTLSQRRKRITALNALRVKQFYRRTMEGI